MYLKRGYQIISYEKIATENGDFLCYHTMEKRAGQECLKKREIWILYKKSGGDPEGDFIQAPAIFFILGKSEWPEWYEWRCLIWISVVWKLLHRFVMINTFMQKSSSGHSIAEFMILPKFRRKKIGKKAAVMCFEKYQGAWEVSPSYGSEQAYLFWKSVIDDYIGTNNKLEDGIFSFCSQSGRHW